MPVSKTGSNIESFERIFRDDKGTLFRAALSESFSFASQIIKISGQKKPEYGLELWDQAVQYKLAKNIQQEKPFYEVINCLLEKQNIAQDWQFGFGITAARSKGQRFWTLPDGILKTSAGVIALEFDHGNTIGKWANQLIKAVRSLASNQLDGVLYCFCMEKNLNNSNTLLSGHEKFTDEFLNLLQANVFEKRLGMITLFPLEWQDKYSYRRKDVIEFFSSAYIG